MLMGASARGQTPASTWSATSPAAERWFGHVEFLANDEMRGRETGSPEHRKAAEYIASNSRPQGSLQGLRRLPAAGVLRVEAPHRGPVEPRAGAGRQGHTGRPRRAGHPWAAHSARPERGRPARVRGQRLSVPEAGLDDFAGLDVKGKVVVIVAGGPAAVPARLSPHCQSAWVRAATLRRLGAVGLVSIPNPRTADVPWARLSANRLAPAMTLADPSLGDGAGMQVAVTFNPAHAEQLFEGSGHTFAELLTLAEARQPLPHFALATAIKARVAIETRVVESGERRRHDRGLATRRSPSEYVVLTAHLDHLGVGEPGQRRQHLQRRHGQRVGHRHPARDRPVGLSGGGQAQAVGAPRRRHGRGEGPARLAVLRSPSDGARGPRSWPTSTWTCSCRCFR